MKKSIWLVVGVVFLLVALPLSSQAAPLKNLSWWAEYYDNPSLSGRPKLTRYEDSMNHDWGTCSPAPDLPCDHFSARWTITRHFDEGNYLFLLTVDDGARVWLDGQLILDAWNVGHKVERKARVLIKETGNHELQVAYFENTGKAMIKLDWILLGGEDDILGAWRGEYFNNSDLEGEPVLVRQDGFINFDWDSGSPSPRVPRDNFSVRWTRSIYLETGSYQFKIQHDDGMRIYVDGKIVYDSWYDQGVSFTICRLHLKGGYRTITIEYYEHTGNAVAYVTFEGDPGSYEDYEPEPAGELIVDNGNGNFFWSGPTNSRYISSGGYLSGFYWTYNSTGSSTNSGKWSAQLGSAGNYEVFVYIPGEHATTTNARYRITYNGGRADRVLNQSLYSDEWVSLGTYYFGGRGDEAVSLYDNTGEAAGSTKVAFDAVKFVKH